MHTGLAVITGTEDRQHAYVALTRGTDTNTAYVFTLSPKRADPVPGPRPAPELARHDKTATAEATGAAPAAEPAGSRDALGVLADVVQRDGQQLSASQTWQQALADADHLAILHAIWTDQTAPAHEQRYKDLLLAALPPGYRHEPGHRAKWLWRTLRAAELAGLDPGQVLAEAIGERDLTGARDVPAVIDARLRRRARARVQRALSAWPDIAKAIGLPGSKIQSASVDLWGWRARVKLARGQTITDMTARIPGIESALGTYRGAVRVYPTGDGKANRCELRVLDTDPHAEAIGWPGPSARSITEPVDLVLQG